jgi:hypothetical protein
MARFAASRLDNDRDGLTERQTDVHRMEDAAGKERVRQHPAAFRRMPFCDLLRLEDSALVIRRKTRRTKTHGVTFRCTSKRYGTVPSDAFVEWQISNCMRAERPLSSCGRRFLRLLKRKRQYCRSASAKMRLIYPSLY